MAKIATLGDFSSHGGTIISSASLTQADDPTNADLIARVGDLHSCPIPGHGVTPIVNGSGNFKTEGKVTAVVGSICGCGAVIIQGSGSSDAPLESPVGAGTFGGALVLGGPAIPAENTFIMG
jgi:uncharacterized Zn-binding protein involved in type VI secretion